MILTVNEFRTYYQTSESDAVLKSKLSAIELMIRAYTNNSFTIRDFMDEMIISEDGVFTGSTHPFKAGDTVQVKNSQMNDGLFTIREVDGSYITVNETVIGESDCGTVTKVVYPADVVMGVVNLMKWELERREKLGIQSETLARHTVNYADPNGSNTEAGYPKSLISFLMPYKRARFGR